MKFKFSKKQMTWGMTAFLVIAAGILFYFLVFEFRNIIKSIQGIMDSIAPVLYGVVIAYILSPVLNFIEHYFLKPIFNRFGASTSLPFLTTEKKFKTMRTIAVTLSIATWIGLLSVVIFFLIPQLITSVMEISRNIPRYINNVNHYINTYLASQPKTQKLAIDLWNSYSDRLYEFWRQTVIPALTDMLQVFSQQLVTLFAGLFNFFIGTIVSIYLLNSKEQICARFKKICYALFKENQANEIISAFRYTHYTFIAFITGKLLDSILVGLICYGGMRVMQLPYPELISVIVGVTNLIPFFGPYIGGIGGALLLVLINPVSALYFLIFEAILQQVDGNILGPYILGNSTGLSSFWVIFSIMFFGALWGAVGWVIGVPVFAVVYALFRKVSDALLRKRGLTLETGVYEELAYMENGEMKFLGDQASTRFNAKRPQSNWKRLLHIGKKLSADAKKRTFTG